MPRLSSVAKIPEAIKALYQATQIGMAECRINVQQAIEMAQSARIMRADAFRDTAAAKKMRDHARKIRAALRSPQN